MRNCVNTGELPEAIYARESQSIIYLEAEVIGMGTEAEQGDGWMVYMGVQSNRRAPLSVWRNSMPGWEVKPMGKLFREWIFDMQVTEKPWGLAEIGMPYTTVLGNRVQGDTFLDFDFDSRYAERWIDYKAMVDGIRHGRLNWVTDNEPDDDDVASTQEVNWWENDDSEED